MIPIPNVLAGILIGIANPTWFTVLISSVVWGFIFYFNVVLWTDRRAQYVINLEIRENEIKNISHNIQFFFVEYFTALITSLFTGTIIYFIKHIFL